ncbi:MAG: DUF1385 domain-containing protein [Ignavibacteriales bacterium]
MKHAVSGSSFSDGLSLSYRNVKIKAVNNDGLITANRDENSKGHINICKALRGFFKDYFLLFFIFIILPMVIAVLSDSHSSKILVETQIRITTLIAFLYFASKLMSDDNKKYHAAEHMTANAIEHNCSVIDFDKINSAPMVHVRCGSNIFVLMFLVFCILTVLLVPPMNFFERFFLELLILYVSFSITVLIVSIPAISYIFSVPGLIIQRICFLKKPDDTHINTALAAANLLMAIVKPKI